MTVTEAFEILKIGIDSSEEEIKKAFHKLCLKVHPDRDPSKNDNEPQKELNEARDVALAYLKVKHSIVPVGVSNSVITSLEKKFTLAEYREETTSYLKKLEARKTISVRQVKYLIWILTAILGFITFLGKEVFPKFNLPIDVQSQLKILTVFAGCIALYFQLMQDNIKNKLEVLTDYFHDKQNCIISLSTALGFEKITSFNSNRLYDGQNDPSNFILYVFFGRITHYERMKILLLKSKENGLIEQNKTEEIKPETLNLYQLKFNPADFGDVSQIKKKEPKPKTADEAKSEFQTGLVVSLVFSVGTACIIYFFKSYWAFLPGTISLFGFLAAITEYFEYLKLKKASGVLIDDNAKETRNEK